MLNMLIHYFSRKEKDWNEYRKLLFEQLESGNLQPESYGTFCDFYSNWRCWKKRKEYQTYYNCYHTDPLYGRLGMVNQRRNEIGIPDD